MGGGHGVHFAPGRSLVPVRKRVLIDAHHYYTFFQRDRVRSYGACLTGHRGGGGTGSCYGPGEFVFISMIKIAFLPNRLFKRGDDVGAYAAFKSQKTLQGGSEEGGIIRLIKFTFRIPYNNAGGLSTTGFILHLRIITFL